MSYSGDALRSLTYNLRLGYVEMLESVCLALESGVHSINMCTLMLNSPLIIV